MNALTGLDVLSELLGMSGCYLSQKWLFRLKENHERMSVDKEPHLLRSTFTKDDLHKIPKVKDMKKKLHQVCGTGGSYTHIMVIKK